MKEKLVRDAKLLIQFQTKSIWTNSEVCITNDAIVESKWNASWGNAHSYEPLTLICN